jgi:hypothetical protein
VLKCGELLENREPSSLAIVKAPPVRCDQDRVLCIPEHDLTGRTFFVGSPVEPTVEGTVQRPAGVHGPPPSESAPSGDALLENARERIVDGIKAIYNPLKWREEFLDEFTVW